MTVKEVFKKVVELKYQLDKLSPMKQVDEERLWKKLRMEFNWNSNHMEGNTLTYGETQLLLLFGQATGNHEMREFEEMKSHDATLKLIREYAKDEEHPLTEVFIKQLNELILVGPFWKDAITPEGQATKREIFPGDYKKHPNHVRLQNGELFEYASPHETPSLMTDLLDTYKVNYASTEIHPLWLAATMHYKLVRIHPFDDGNGRVARLVMNYILLKKGFPPIVLKSNDKKAYLLALNQADVGNEKFFHHYLGEQLILSLELAIKAAKGEDIRDEDDFEKEMKEIQSKLGHNKTDVVEINKQLIGEVMEKSFIPLSVLLAEKLEQMATLFVQFNTTIVIDNSRTLLDKQQKIDSALKTCLFQQRNATFGEGKIIYEWNGFKRADIHAFSVHSEFSFRFEKFKYSVKENNSPQALFEKLYGNQLTETEMKKIADKVASAALTALKLNYKAATGQDL
jgi:Fic family protein